MAMTPICISIVSHGQMALVMPLLRDLERIHRDTPLDVLLTLNVPEPLPCTPDDFSFALHIIHNPHPLGFGANHNQALARAQGDLYCILNPDIRLANNPFPPLINMLRNPAIGLATPVVRNPAGALEDSARRFPTPWRIAHRVLTRRRTRDYVVAESPLYPDWVGGMFMLLPATLYRQLGGFDERYFLYYEDVDLCARIRLLGLEIALHPHAIVTHDAQRSSHKNLQYLRWHLGSMLRFFSSRVFMRIQWQRIMGHPYP